MSGLRLESHVARFFVIGVIVSTVYQFRQDVFPKYFNFSNKENNSFLSYANKYKDLTKGEVLPLSSVSLNSFKNIVLDDDKGSIYVTGGDDKSLGTKSNRFKSIFANDFSLNSKGNLSLGGTLDVDKDISTDESISANGDIELRGSLSDENDDTLRLNDKLNVVKREIFSSGGDLTLLDNINLGESSLSSISLIGGLDTNVLPLTDNTYNIGSPSLFFSNAYITNIYGGSSGAFGYWNRTSTTLLPLTLSDNIATTGNIGVGTSTPRNALDVSGSSAFGSLPSNSLPQANSAYFSGNVGIGTTNPLFKLDIAGNIGPSTNDTYDLGSNSLRWQDLYLGSNTLHIGSSTTDEYTIDYDTLANRLDFNVNGSGNPEIVFNSSGYIGIGTTSPNSELEIYSTDSTLSGVRFSSSTAGTNYSIGVGDGSPFNDALTFISGSTQYAFMNSQGNWGYGFAGTPGSRLSVSGGLSLGSSYATTASPSNGAIIEGNVGIGTTNPGANIDVRGSAVFNENGADADFRIESDTMPYMFAIDAGDGLGGGANLGAAFFGFSSLPANPGVLSTRAAGNNNIALGIYNSSNSAVIQFLGSGAQSYMNNAAFTVLNHDGISSKNRLTIPSQSATVVNEDGENFDFRIEGDTNSGLFFVDASADSIGIGTTAPSQTLSIAGNIELTNNSIYTSKSTLGSTWALMWLDNGNDLFLNNPGGDIFIRPNGSTQISALSGGNVGIGTENPLAKFHVLGNLAIGTTTPGNMLDVSGSVAFGALPSNPLPQANSAYFSGNVGIGTTGPGYKLELAGAGTAALGYTGNRSWKIINTLPGIDNRYLSIVEDTSSVTAMTFAYSTGRVGLNGEFAPGSQLSVSGNASIGNTYRTLSAPTNGLIVEGNVGIGTSSPLAKLDVLGLSDIVQLQIKGNTTQTNRYLSVLNYGGGNVFYISGNDNVFSSGTLTAGRITSNYNNNAENPGFNFGGASGMFNPATNVVAFSTNSLERVRIDLSGNLGVGTTNPRNMLDVSGSVAFGALPSNPLPQANSAYFSGNVGIGTTNPIAALHIAPTSTSILPLKVVHPTGFTVNLAEFINRSGSTSITFDYDGGATFTGRFMPNSVEIIQTGSAGIPVLRQVNNDTGIFFPVNNGDLIGFSTNAVERARFNSSGNLGIGTTNPLYTLDVKSSGTDIARFNGSNLTGCTLSDGGVIACSSDINLKKNISGVSYGLSDILKLKPVEFNWKNENDDTSKSLGFIAQDVESMIPKLVSTDSSGYKQLNSVGLIPILTKAIQEQDIRIKALEELGLSKESTESTSTISSDTKILAEIVKVYDEFKDFIEALGMSNKDGKLVVSSDTNVLGDITLSDVLVTGDFRLGFIQIDSLENSIQTIGVNQTLYLQKNLSGNVDLFNGKVVFEKDGSVKFEGVVAGNSSIRDKEKLEAGKNEIEIKRVWKDAPVSIVVTPSYETKAWVENTTKDGFTIRVSEISPEDQTLYWIAIW